MNDLHQLEIPSSNQAISGPHELIEVELDTDDGMEALTINPWDYIDVPEPTPRGEEGVQGIHGSCAWQFAATK
jgi:hypothetical protein